MEQVFQVGIISSTHGVRGEVKVFPTTDDMKRFKKLKEILLDTGKEYMTLQMEWSFCHQGKCCEASKRRIFYSRSDRS